MHRWCCRRAWCLCWNLWRVGCWAICPQGNLSFVSFHRRSCLCLNLDKQHCSWLSTASHAQVVLPQSLVPVLGSVEGRLLGVADLPSGLITYAGAALVLVASVIVLIMAHLREQVSPRLYRQVMWSEAHAECLGGGEEH